MIMTEDVNGNLTYSGIDQEILDELFQRLNWTYVNIFLESINVTYVYLFIIID